MVIEAEYDTVFPFNKQNTLALVAKENIYNTDINPLTGEKEKSYDFFYINAKNQTLKVLANDFPDSLEQLPFQQEFHLKYLDNTSHIYVLFQDKVYLFSKEGKQLTKGYDNITYQEHLKGYILENSIEKNGRIYLYKGLYITDSKLSIPDKYKMIEFNSTDSLYVCCSAVIDNSKNDDIYNYKGKLIAYSNEHIEFASKNCLITKVYQPKPTFWIDDKKLNKKYDLEGEELIPLKNNHCLLISKNNYTLLNLTTHKRSKVNASEIYNIIFALID